MPVVDVVNLKKEKVGSIELNDEIFGQKVNIALVHQVIKAQLAGRRQGTAKTKTKAEVRGGGRKPFRQKGTGRARQGSIRSPLQPGGGQSFGPVPRSYDQATPKKMIQGALFSALSDRLNSGRLLIVDGIDLEAPKTKSFSIALKSGLGVEKVLIVDLPNKNLELSARNLINVKVLRAEGVNPYDVVHKEWVVLTKRAVEFMDTRLKESCSKAQEG